MLTRFFRSISFTLVVALVVTSIPVAAPSAWAQAANCSSASAADRGEVAGCAAVRLENGLTVAYPKIQWTRISDAPASGVTSGSAIVSSPEAVTLANRSAVALGVSSNEISSAIQAFPSNVPLVFARYNPMEATLRIDLFKLEKATVGSQTRAGLYHASFSPAHGDYWKAARAYISPTDQQSGNRAGVNPFELFKGSDSSLFYNVSLGGAQVAVGHAMRYLRAPMGVLAVASARYTQRTEKSGNAFKKKTKTIVTAHVKPAWMIAYPAQFQQRNTSLPMASFCANDPKAGTCKAYQVATAGVVFEEFEGGTLSADENAWDVWEKTKSGLGFLAVLAIAVVLSFTIAGAIGAMGIGAGAGAGATGAAVGGGTAAGASASAGIFGSLMTAGTGVGFSGVISAVALESAVVGSLMMLGGANLSSMMHFSPSAIVGDVDVVSGYLEGPELDQFQAPTSAKVQPLTVSNFVTGGATLDGFTDTVVGDTSSCPVGAPLSACSAGATGVILRHDQYIEQNQVQFLRDNGGKVIRNDSPVGPALPVQ